MNRYNLDSCDTLEPSFVEEKYSQFNIGVNDDDEENSDLEINDSPKKGSNRNKPFEINISFDQYRRNREYKGMSLSNIMQHAHQGQKIVKVCF